MGSINSGGLPSLLANNLWYEKIKSIFLEKKIVLIKKKKEVKKIFIDIIGG
jgi:hypothetical protein